MRASRVTESQLDVAAFLLRASAEAEEPHGWMIMKGTKRSGPTVYGILDRFEDRGWIKGCWEEQDPVSSKPRRRFYRVTSEGATGMRELLASRRSATLRDHASRRTATSAGSRSAIMPGGAR